ncbi:unnamed protein product [Symbiodinium natans]|uniref:Uncharacterized protein n=1 Tax=Symbiodinium natans TaxID=878477 RepID=A0A812RWM8_9DINO|nr:unnamed protein product [Symbiodinium natans]
MSSSHDGTPTPTTIRVRDMVPTPMWGNEVLALKTRHSCESTDGSFIVGTEDLSSFEGDDSDEKLLALLGDLALGAEETEDPTARALLDQCGALWEEVHVEAEARWELQCRLRRELQHLQDRSHWQHAESGAFLQRLSVAREALAEKIQEASSENQTLRQRLLRHRAEEEQLQCGLAQNLRHLSARAAELRAAVWEVGVDQAELVEKLRRQTEQQALLQTELQQERVKTWRQSTDVVMAFAGGKESGKELEREEADRVLLESQLAEVASRAAAVGIPPLCDEEPEVAEAVLAAADVVPYATLLGHLDGVEELRAAMEALEGSCAQATAQQKEEEEKLETEQLELSRLTTEMADAEATVNGQDLDQATSLVSVLCGELQSEQAVLREERSAAGRRRDLFRAQVEEKRRELARLREMNDRLVEDLNSKGCFKHRKP